MRKKILIVEDEFVVANDLSIMLEAAGYQITGIAISANVALEEIGKIRPDLVLLDIQLQGPVSGIDLARQLKTFNIAYVYLSANSDHATLQRAKATEPLGFLVKPVRVKDLMVTLDIACYRHEHSLESFLFRRDRLRRELIVLTGEQGDRNTILSRFAASLEVVVPFDLLCFACTTADAGHQFIGLYRSGFGEYQEIDKADLINIAAKSEKEVDSILSGVLMTPEMQQFEGTSYPLLLAEDPLACMLDRCYHFQAVIRGAIELPALPNCKMYIFSKEGNRYDERHLSVLEGMQNLIGKLVMGLDWKDKLVMVSMNRKGMLIRDFFALLENAFTTAKTVDYYAGKLCVSPKHLSNVIKMESGHPTSYHINQRIVVEAKRMTQASGASLKQIAFDLGYEDVAAFSKLFKRVTGENFSTYKSHLRLVFRQPVDASVKKE
jgi:CheY-like chemotaxis protein/AraC-like DNA-binding protein